MNQSPFPKPPPADPLPLATWLDQTDRAEVDRESFFRGCNAEFDVFRKAAVSPYERRVGSGMMIFQGASRAAKSARMVECLEAVRLHSTPEDSRVVVVKTLVQATSTDSERLRAIGGAGDWRSCCLLGSMILTLSTLILSVPMRLWWSNSFRWRYVRVGQATRDGGVWHSPLPFKAPIIGR